MHSMKKTIELSDPRTLRALAHPTRLALVGLLRQHGTLTATQAAQLLGLNSGACSFHRRQLAKYVLVEEVSSPCRQKLWRATAEATSWPAVATEPEMTAAVRLLSGVLVERYADIMLSWVDRRPDEPEAWQRAGWLGDALLHITADELNDLREQIERLVAPYERRVFEQDSRPAGSRPVSVLQAAIPLNAAGDAEREKGKEPT